MGNVRGWSGATLAALVVGCADKPSTGPVEGPSFVISDAVHGSGKPHFYFLPPMVPTPVTAGTFDAALAPEVQICRLEPGGDACGEVVALFTTTGDWGSEQVRVSTTDEHYIVNWHTDESGLDAAATYRMRILVDGIELGFADVDVVESGRELRNVNTNAYIPLLDGRTLPIKFRVETGFLARIDVEPAEASIYVGETQQFTATFTDLHGGALGVAASWVSSDETVGMVSPTGLVSGSAAGTTAITVVAAGVQGNALLTVLEPTPEEPPTGPECDATGCIVHDAAWTTSRAMDVNVNGQMVLAVQRIEGGQIRNRAFYWDGEVDHAPVLLDQAQAVHCTPHAINIHGAIVGSCTFPAGGGGGAVYWAGPTAPLQQLQVVPGAPLQLNARNINDAGVIVGSAPRQYQPSGGALTWAGTAARWESRAAAPVTFSWSSTWIVPGGTLWGVSPSGRMAGQSSVVLPFVCGVGCFSNADVPRAGALNAGAVAGAAVGPLVTPSVPATINNGLSRSLAFAINDAGVAVGWTDAYVSSINSIRHLARRWSGATLAVIPGVPVASVTASEATDINEAGWITGFWGSGTTITGQAFVWKGVLAVPALALPRGPGSVSARANAVSQVFAGPDAVMQAYVAGQVSVTTSSNLRAVRWLVIQ